MQYAHIESFQDPWTFTQDTDEDGEYSIAGSSPLLADMHLRSTSLGLTHAESQGFNGDNCAAREESELSVREVTLGIADTAWYNSDSDYSRTDALAFGWLTYLRGLQPGLSDHAEFPNRIWFDTIGPPDGGAARSLAFPCDEEESFLHVESAGADSAANVTWARYSVGHEYAHTLQYCSETVGEDCEYTPDFSNPFWGAWTEGQATVFGHWFEQYETTENNTRWWMTPYEGPGTLDDIFVHQEEIESTAPWDEMGCQKDLRPCPSGEACWPGATDIPRCFLIATDQDSDLDIDALDCQLLFSDIPGLTAGVGGPSG